MKICAHIIESMKNNVCIGCDLAGRSGESVHEHRYGILFILSGSEVSAIEFIHSNPVLIIIIRRFPNWQYIVVYFGILHSILWYHSNYRMQ